MSEGEECVWGVLLVLGDQTGEGERAGEGGQRGEEGTKPGVLYWVWGHGEGGTKGLPELEASGDTEAGYLGWG